MKVIKKSFGIILTLSIISLVLLITGVFFLSKGKDKTFTSDGYIIQYKSGNTDVYNFKEGVVYKYNVNGDLVFKNTKSKKVTAEIENFIHYNNGDIAFLKNGVLLDLDNVSETAVPYYTITNKSLLDYENDEYVVANINGDLKFNRFIGRISENKYIVSAKNITAKLSGKSEMITSKAKGSFFEITYAENGVVVISDGETTHTTTADKSYIYIGEDLVIGLGDKNIYYKDEQKVSLNQMTIDGDENIEIIPPEETEAQKLAREQAEAQKKLEEERKRIEAELAEIARQQRENNLANENARLAAERQRLEAELKANEEARKQLENERNKIEKDKNKIEEQKKRLEELLSQENSITKNPIFRVVKAEIGANKLDLDIDIIDEYKVINGNLDVAIINMKTGNTVYRDTITDISEVAKITTPTGTLAPKTNYIVSITGNYKNEGVNYNKQFFQRVFVTDELGINFNKDYTTSSEISMVVTVDNTLVVKGFDVTVYDKNDTEIEKKTVTINSTSTSVLFEELNSNTDYNVVLNNITYNNVVYTDTNNDSSYREGDYTLTQKVKTLKKKPAVNDIKAIVDNEKTKVTFKLDDIVDTDKAITGYRYYIYTYDSVTGTGGTNPVMDPISKKDATAFDVEIDGTHLMSGKSYRYMVVVEYNDNEKDVEYNTGYSNSFVAGAVPSLTFEQDNDKTTFNTISGTLKISDENCTVPMSGRECNNIANNIYVRYYEAGTTTVSYNSVEAEFDPTTLQYRFTTSGLKEHTDYVIEVFGSVDFKDGNGNHECNAQKYENGECIQIGESINARTKSVVPVKVNWGNEKLSNTDQVFSLGGNRMASKESSDAEAKAMASLNIKVYASSTRNIEDGRLIKTVTKNTNLKALFFDTDFTISSTNTFGLDINDLKRETNGILTKYYIFELDEAYDSGQINSIPIENSSYVFEINPDLRADDILTEPQITTRVTKSNNVDSKVTVTAEYDADNLELLYPNANFYLVLGACSITTGQCHNLRSEQLEELTSIYIKEFSINDGTDYYTDDPIKDSSNNITLYRGNKYRFRFYIIVDDEKDGSNDYYYPGRTDARYIESSPVVTTKTAETFKMNIVSSTEDSITYNFNIGNPDKILYKDENDEKYSIYYEVNGSTHKVAINNFLQDTNFTISNLDSNTRYRIYYKKAPTKTGHAIDDVVITNENKYTFDGFYDLADNELKYTIENMPPANKVRIKILNTGNIENIINRITTFHVEITDKDVNRVIDNKYYTAPNDCNSGCYKYIDYNYANLEKYNNVSYTSLNHNLEVKLYAYYDTGLIANSFAAGYSSISNPNTSEYGYLLQQYSNEIGQGKYLVLDTTNHVIESENPLDLYYYTMTGNKMILYNLIKDNVYHTYEQAPNDAIGNRIYYNSSDINLARLADGYKFGNYTVNVKTTAQKTITSDDSTIFKYETIIPNISTDYDAIINGADIRIDSTNITSSVLEKYFVKENNKYYYYVDIYDENDTLIEEKKKIEINPGVDTEFTIQNLNANTTYTFKVYATLTNGGYSQLNDVITDEPKTYEFTTLKGSDLYGNIDVNYRSYSTNTQEDKTFMNRDLTLDITLNTEVTNVLKNYDLVVNLIQGNKIVKTTTITNNELNNNNEVTFTITKEEDGDPNAIIPENIIYGTDYFVVQMLAKTTNRSGETTETIFDDQISLNELRTPIINVTKSAKTEIEESNYIYSLEYEISINDIDRVIKEGKYSLVLLNNAGEVVKTVSDLTINLNNYSELKTITFSNVSEDENYQVDLQPNKEYTLQVVFDTYRNNQSIREEAINQGAEISSYINQHNIYNYSIYTSGIYGVSLGEISLSATSNTVEMKFFSSSNLDKLTKISYTITKEGESTPITSKEYTLGENGQKNFSVIEGTNNDKYYSLLLDDEDIVLQNRTKYLLTFQFYITDELGVQQPISTSNNTKYVTIG